MYIKQSWSVAIFHLRQIPLLKFISLVPQMYSSQPLSWSEFPGDEILTELQSESKGHTYTALVPLPWHFSNAAMFTCPYFKRWHFKWKWPANSIANCLNNFLFSFSFPQFFKKWLPEANLAYAVLPPITNSFSMIIEGNCSLALRMIILSKS